jgi:hypothetical protein
VCRPDGPAHLNELQRLPENSAGAAVGRFRDKLPVPLIGKHKESHHWVELREHIGSLVPEAVQE